MLCYVMLCFVMLCYVMLCYIMLCYVMLCFVMLCYFMLNHAMSLIQNTFSKETNLKFEFFVFLGDVCVCLLKRFQFFKPAFCQSSLLFKFIFYVVNLRNKEDVNE